MDKRRGKAVKTSRSGVLLRKSTTDPEELFERFVHSKKASGRATGTIEGYRRHFNVLKRFADSEGIGLTIKVLDAEFFKDFIVYMLEDYEKFKDHKFKRDEHKEIGLSPRFANDVIKTFRQFFDYLVDQEVLSHNVLNRVDPIKYSEPAIEVMSPDEVRHFFSCLDQRSYTEFRDYILSNFLLDAMTRIEETLRLKVSDFDFDSNYVRIRAELTKSRKARVVPFQKRTAKLLKELIAENEEFNTDYVFLANYGEPLEPNHFRTQLRRYAKRAGMRRHFYPHLFRHTGATWFLENGGDLRTLQMILGHADLRMTMRYTHLSGRSIAKSHDQFSPLNNVIGKLNKDRKLKR
ncbi:tyrosine-type recombinase/integrase [Shouchella clausii]|uniref:tyrosine-type recombinase/integrase n=1 Tax=Shouchella clausii TaxID=79880 RepID=UPI000BA769E3|nr:tyrosine-type recombinase/integrase [Shouchella clausii]PAD91678.1 integrase [Shouchella clausii]